MFVLRVVLVVVCLILGVVRGAQADARSEAIALYQEGARAYKAADYATALDRFARSNGRLESASTVFNIAQCHRQLGHHAEAARAYRRYLELKPTASDAVEVQRLAAREEELARPAPPPVPRVVEQPGPVVMQHPSEEKSSRTGLVVGVTVGVLLVVGLSLGVGLGVGLQSRGPKSDLGTIRPEFN